MHNPKLSLRHLLIGALLAIWCAALSGVCASPRAAGAAGAPPHRQHRRSAAYHGLPQPSLVAAPTQDQAGVQSQLRFAQCHPRVLCAGVPCASCAHRPRFDSLDQRPGFALAAHWRNGCVADRPRRAHSLALAPARDQHTRTAEPGAGQRPERACSPEMAGERSGCSVRHWSAGAGHAESRPRQFWKRESHWNTPAWERAR